MFSLQVTDTDIFLDMPSGAQALYFHLGMHGDDDGFVSSPRKIARAVGCNDDDLRLLAAKGYIIPFDSSVVVITDWNINNTLKNDRYHPTIYVEEKAKLTADNNGRLVLTGSAEPTRNQNVSMSEPEHNTTKHNTTKHNLNKADKAAKPPRATRFTPPSLEEVQDYCREKGYQIDAECFVSYYGANGWRVGRNPMKSWESAVRMWAAKNREEGKKRGKNQSEPILHFNEL